MLTGEPLLIVSPSPPQCSDAVIGLVSLLSFLFCFVFYYLFLFVFYILLYFYYLFDTTQISPLRYCGDYRPYFTIHDSDFRAYTQPNEGNPLPSLHLLIYPSVSHFPSSPASLVTLSFYVMIFFLLFSYSSSPTYYFAHPF